MSFQTVLQKYRSDSYSERDKGSRFEELISRYLMTDPTYASMLDRVWSWMDFSGHTELGGGDTGIDLVARTKDGEYWAVQCKCYAEDHSVTKADMDTFLSTSGRRFHDEDGKETSFALRVIVATTDNWSSNAIEVTKGQTIPVTIIGLNILESAPVDWNEIEAGVHGKDARHKAYELREHQKEALEAALNHYRDHDRGKMIMACGTGKTFTSLRITEAILSRDGPADGKGCVLFLAPSISLVGQTLREWTANAVMPITPICVCSDPTVTKKKTEDDIGERVEDLGMPATTDPGRIAFAYMTSHDTVVIFSTYQSLDAVIVAQNHGLPEFDLIVCDEAHRTTGVIVDKQDESSFTKVHDNNLVHGRKRLYMTASNAGTSTPSLRQRTLERILHSGESCFSQPMILTTTARDIPDIIKRHWTDKNGEIDTDTNCRIWGCLNALAKNVAYDTTVKTTDPAPMRSAVSFCRSIKVSRALCDMFNKMAREPMSPRQVSMRHIDGSMSSMERDKLLGWLKQDSPECRILSNVRCLSEGVDVPALDAVMLSMFPHWMRSCSWTPRGPWSMWSNQSAES